MARTAPRGGHVAMVLWKNLYTNAPTPTSLLVLGSETGPSGRVWVKMLLPKRPNGSVGWVPADQLVLHRTAWRVEISTAKRQGLVFHHGHVVKRFPVIVGASSTPTPRGLTAIQDRRKQADPNGFYGAWILALDARSSAYQEFLGGPGTDRDPRCRSWQSPRHRHLPRLHPREPIARCLARPPPRARYAGRDRRAEHLTPELLAPARERGADDAERAAGHRDQRRRLREQEPAEQDRDRHDEVRRRAETAGLGASECE